MSSETRESANRSFSSQDFIDNALGAKAGDGDKAAQAFRSEAFQSMAKDGPKNGLTRGEERIANPSLSDTLTKFSADDRSYLAMRSSSNSDAFIQAVIEVRNNQSIHLNNATEQKQIASLSGSGSPIFEQVHHTRQSDSIADIETTLEKEWAHYNKGDRAKELLSANEYAIFTAINRHRRALKLSELKLGSERLGKKAERNSTLINTDGVGHHAGPGWEIAAWGNKGTIKDWLDSPEHRKIIENPGLTRMYPSIVNNGRTVAFS